MEVLSVSPELMGYVDHSLPITKNVYELLLGIINDKIIGYLIIGKDSSGYKIEHLFIDEKHRRNGFGTELLKTCLGSYKHIRLIVSATNQPAMDLYKKHGFKLSYSKGRYHVMMM